MTLNETLILIPLNILLTLTAVFLICLLPFQIYRFNKTWRAHIAARNIKAKSVNSSKTIRYWVNPIIGDFGDSATVESKRVDPSRRELCMQLAGMFFNLVLVAGATFNIYTLYYYNQARPDTLEPVHSFNSLFTKTGALFPSVVRSMWINERTLITERLSETCNFLLKNPAFKHPIDVEYNVCWEFLPFLYSRLLNSILSHTNNLVLIDSDFFLYGAFKHAFSLWSTIRDQLFLDGISLWLTALTFFVIFALGISTYEDKTRKVAPKQLLLAALVAILSVVCFLTRDLLVFFMSFEATLVPLFFLVGYFGSRSEKVRAATYLFVFTLVGSGFLWVGLLYCYAVLGVTNFDALTVLFDNSTNGAADFIFWCLVLGFAFKVPVFLFHIWLTVAHVEAPTVGSVLLAGLVLKLGGYGLLRWVVLLLPLQTVNWGVYVTWFCMVGYVIATLFAVQQSDLKRFVAYTSISHMNFGAAVLFNHTDMGILAYVHTMISHGIIATALFMLVGFVYYQAGCRDSLSVSALSTTAPRFATLWFIFVVANAGIPLFSAFPGEFFGLVSLMESNGFMLFAIAFVGFFVTAVYSFVVLIRVLYGTLGDQVVATIRDVSRTFEQLIITLLGLSVFLGMSPDVLFRTALLDLKSPICIDGERRMHGFNLYTDYLLEEIGRRVVASSLLEPTPEGYRDYFARHVQWVHGNPGFLAIERFLLDFKAFIFMGSLNTPEVTTYMINKIRWVLDNHPNCLIDREHRVLRQFILLLELSQNLGKAPLPVAQEPKLTYGAAFTRETCCDASMYDAWYSVVHIWGPNGVVSKMKDADFSKVLFSPIALCDTRIETIMYRPQDISTSRAIISDTKLKDVRVNVGMEDALYIAKLSKLPEFKIEDPLAHNPTDYSPNCIRRYSIMDGTHRMPQQPDIRLGKTYN